MQYPKDDMIAPLWSLWTAWSTLRHTKLWKVRRSSAWPRNTCWCLSDSRHDRRGRTRFASKRKATSILATSDRYRQSVIDLTPHALVGSALKPELGQTAGAVTHEVAQ